MNKSIDRRVLWLTVSAALVVLGMAFVVSCSCKSGHDDDDDSDDDHNAGTDDDNNNDATDDDSAPPADCQIVQCEPHEMDSWPNERAGACFPEECQESDNQSWDGCSQTVGPCCYEAVVLDGLMWSRCSSFRTAHFCAACSAQEIELCGYDDWRLPTYDEARSLYDPSRRVDVRGHIADAFIRRPFKIDYSSTVWLFADEDATNDDFGLQYDFRNDKVDDVSPYGCYTIAFFVRDLDGTESFVLKERSHTSGEKSQ